MGLFILGGMLCGLVACAHFEAQYIYYLELLNVYQPCMPVQYIEINMIISTCTDGQNKAKEKKTSAPDVNVIRAI
jgi:hypothetical protein